MDPLVADFLQCVRRKVPCHSIIENTIATRCLSVTVSPSLCAPVAEKLVLAFPVDYCDEERQLCRALKALLVGSGNLPALRSRSRAALEINRTYVETLEGWRLQFYVNGARKSLKAERLPHGKETSPASITEFVL
ncbi:MAG: hypothetical protein V4726_02135 [Verrucomicrobiota bacterium]